MRVLSLVLAFIFACSSTAVRQQATAAEVVARSWNQALPVWIAVYEQEANAASDAETTEEAAYAAAERVRRKWQTVQLFWDMSRTRHRIWKNKLLQCQEMQQTSADTPCMISAGDLLQDFATYALRWRCEVRRVGRPDLDPLPGVPDCTNLPDGGTQ